ncbi:hypothetical protein RSAG8_01548, partial [Rhizoctonia solani AG-8 WAC10335]
MHCPYSQTHFGRTLHQSQTSIGSMRMYAFTDLPVAFIIASPFENTLDALEQIHFTTRLIV